MEYQQNQFINIRDSFKVRFPESKHLFTVDSLRNRFYRILRKGVKKLKRIVGSYRDRLPEMVILDDERAKSMIKSAAGAAIKLQIIKIYKMSEAKVDLAVIRQTIEQVNEFVISREKGITFTAREVAQDKWAYEIHCKELSGVSNDC